MHLILTLVFFTKMEKYMIIRSARGVWGRGRICSIALLVGRCTQGSHGGLGATDSVRAFCFGQWRGLPSLHGTKGCTGQQSCPRGLCVLGVQGREVCGFEQWRKNVFFFLNLDCCLHKFWSVLHGLCAFFSLYAIFFSFSSRNLSSWENMPEDGCGRKVILCVLSLRPNFGNENSSWRDS